jgi:hypothetical protein
MNFRFRSDNLAYMLLGLGLGITTGRVWFVGVDTKTTILVGSAIMIFGALFRTKPRPVREDAPRL